MSFPLQFRPDEAVAEIMEFNSRLGDLLQQLPELGELRAGCSAKEIVYQTDALKLHRFAAHVDKPHPTPLLICYALVNRPWIADLQEGRSLIQGLLQQGLDVYLLEWNDPGPSDRLRGLDEYINGYLDESVGYLQRSHGLDRIDLLGICQGGTFSLCYTALHPEKINNLVTTVTPVDFHTPDDMLAHLVRHVDIDLAVDVMGNIPADTLNGVFVSLQPYQLLVQKYVNLVETTETTEQARNFLRMEQWIFNGPDQAGEAYREFIKQFYQQNALITGEARIGEQAVDLKNITCPVLNVYAIKDRLVPPASSKALEKRTGSRDYTALEFPGGHIGLYVSGNAQKTIPPAIADWLKQRG